MVAKPKEISDAKARSIKIVYKESLDSGFDYSSPESKALIGEYPEFCVNVH